MDPSDFKILPSRSVLSAGRIVRSGVILPLRFWVRLMFRARRAGRYRNWFPAPLENRYPPYSTSSVGTNEIFGYHAVYHSKLLIREIGETDDRPLASPDFS